MTASIDHLVYACPDLGPAVDRIAAQTGVRPAFGGQHPGLGTHNALLSLGGRTYLEIIAPDPGQPPPAGPLPFGLDALTEPGLRAWAAAPGDLDAVVRESAAGGFDYGPIVDRSRRTADGHELTWRMTTYPDSAQVAVTPFLIDWNGSPHPAAAAPAGLRLHEFRLRCPAPDRLAARLRALGLDLNVDEAELPGLSAVLVGPQGQRVVLD
ncbi:MAG TPA: VOC family protein [Streptosporangiaceae bacterium]|nr:VOC family protein [Streptosporangiaceae bacterium]